LPAGGRPAATHFSLLSPKKSKQKKGDRKTLPCGFPFVQVKKWENVETHFAALRSNTTLSYPFFAPHKRQRLKRKGLIKHTVFHWFRFERSV
jgi:hypothetical protein